MWMRIMTVNIWIVDYAVFKDISFYMPLENNFGIAFCYLQMDVKKPTNVKIVKIKGILPPRFPPLLLHPNLFLTNLIYMRRC